MALTISVVKRSVVGDLRCVVADVTFDSSYPDGGEAFGPSDVDPAQASGAAFHWCSVGMNDATDADNRIASYDYTNKKLRLFTAGATEAVDTSDQSAVKVRVMGLYGGQS